MQGNLQKTGHYELFETSKGHQILNLNDKDFYAVVEGQKGDILVRSDPDHKKKSTVNQGDFYLADFSDDPEFNDIPHLFLQDTNSQFREWILPEGVPTNRDHQKKLVRSENRVGKDKVKYHTEGSGRKGREKQYEGTSKSANSRAEAAGKRPEGRGDGGSQDDALSDKTKEELYTLAQKKQIDGRSKMGKQELINSLRRVGE